MRLKLINPIAPIRNLPEIELPDFTLITGPNGAGKTRLLQAILNGDVATVGAKAGDVIYKDIQSILAEASLSPRDGGVVQTAYNTYTDHRRLVLGNLSAAFRLAQLPEELSKNSEVIVCLSREEIGSYPTGGKSDLVWKLISDAKDEFVATLPASPTTTAEAIDFLHHVISKSKAEGQNVLCLDEKEFFDDHSHVYGVAPFLQSTLTALFSVYLAKENQFGARTFGLWSRQPSTKADVQADVEAEISDFRNRYGPPPWDEMNKVLSNMGLGISIVPPTWHPQGHHQLSLKKEASGAYLTFNLLSSGERILFALAVAIFQSSDRRIATKFPSVLLLDEIDAFLHPTMVEKLIALIEKVFVKEKGIKVIAVTHSPTTIALSPNESIFVVDEKGDLKHTEKDKAIRQLTVGLPTLSIDYDARRYVLTESTYDAAAYSTLFEVIRRTNPETFNTKRSISFVGTGASRNGGSAVVERLVRTFREAGNKGFFGVIDWDGKNSPNQAIAVLGFERRYALETILFDPLVIGAAIGREDREFNLAGYGVLPSHLEFASIDDKKRQAIADGIISLVLADISPALHGNRIEAKYVDGRSISVPHRYLHMNGHELHELAVGKFPILKKYGSGEAILQNIAAYVLNDVPDLVPMEVKELFEWLVSEER